MSLTQTAAPAGHAPEGVRRQDARPTHRSSPLLGLLPYIGVILFTVHAATILTGDRTGDWTWDLLGYGVYYMIGVAGIGAGVAHILFGRGISRSIGWEPSPFETEVGFANLAFGVVGLMALSQGAGFLLAVIVASSVFRAGCGIGHIREMVRRRNFAVNNTAILLLNFGVPAFLVLAYNLWAI